MAAVVLERFDVASGAATPLATGDGEVADCTADASGSKIAYSYDDATHPPEVFVLDTVSGETHELTQLNGGFLGDVTLATIEPFGVSGRAGFPVSAWIMRPPGATAGRRYPTLLEIHGGPETEYGNAYLQEFQVLAARGYNVVFADPRGSVGFGYPFEAALRKNWGDPMFEDEMAVMDAVVKRPDVDARRQRPDVADIRGRLCVDPGRASVVGRTLERSAYVSSTVSAYLRRSRTHTDVDDS